MWQLLNVGNSSRAALRIAQTTVHRQYATRTCGGTPSQQGPAEALLDFRSLGFTGSSIAATIHVEPYGDLQALLDLEVFVPQH